MKLIILMALLLLPGAIYAKEIELVRGHQYTVPNGKARVLQDSSSQKVLQFLQEWDSEYHTYNLMTFHGVEIYNALEKLPYLEDWWDIDLTGYFDDEFVSFSTEGGTGYFAFWYYPTLAGVVPPVVRLSSEAEDPEILASNLNDLVCRMLHNIYFHFDSVGMQRKKPNEEELKELYYGLIDDYENEFGKEVSLEEIQLLLEKDRIEFKRKALKVISFISEDEIENNIKKHPSIIERNKEFENKNSELLPDDQSSEFSVTLESLPKILEGFDILLRNSDSQFNAEQIIASFKSKHPELYDTALFQEWLKKQ